jgi:hypothetical protein
MEDDIEVYENAPKEVKDILNSYDELADNYFTESKRIIAELEKHGYTADYDMSGELFDLTKI